MLSWKTPILTLFVVCAGVVILPSLAQGQGAAYFSKKNPLVDKTADAEVQWVQVPWSATQNKITDDSLVNVIRWWVNWVLGIMALIALIVVIRWWFQMVTANGDEGKFGAWYTLLKQAIIWIILIWVAWFIVSLVFWLINLTTTPTIGTGAGTES
jgi:hypothetical protein